MQPYGFHFVGYLNGRKDPVIRKYLFKDTETLTKGDLLNLEDGEVDLAATNDSAIVGVANETKSGIDSTTEIEVIIGWDAIFAVYDPNARVEGATLDIAGTTGAMTLATDSNHDVIVHANSTASEPTYIRILPGEHAQLNL